LYSLAGNRPAAPVFCRASPRRRRGYNVVRYENLIHDYGVLNAISQVPAVRDALHQAGETLRKHLG